MAKKLNLFDNAKEVVAEKPKKKDEKVEVSIDGLETYASITALEKSLEALKTSLRSSLDKQMLDHFVKEGLRRGSRPPSFRGVEGGASASMELRARSSSSPLSEEEVERLKSLGISTREVEGVATTFRINPKYREDGDLLEKVSTALSKVKGLPDDFLERQVGSKKTILTETSLDELFKLDEDEVRNLVSLVGVLAIKAKLESDDLKTVLKVVGKMVA